jgi:hypothetical protein
MPVQMNIAKHPALKAVPGILNAMNVGRWSSWSEFCESMTPEERSAKKAWETRYGKGPDARAAWERVMLDFSLEQLLKELIRWQILRDFLLLETRFEIIFWFSVNPRASPKPINDSS